MTKQNLELKMNDNAKLVLKRNGLKWQYTILIPRSLNLYCTWAREFCSIYIYIDLLLYKEYIPLPTTQPYRTAPLVLPQARTIHDTGYPEKRYCTVTTTASLDRQIQGEVRHGHACCKLAAWRDRSHNSCDCVYRKHRGTIITEEKAKVIASVWGEYFIQFLAALANVH